jgi:hypothetical protein
MTQVFERGGEKLKSGKVWMGKINRFNLLAGESSIITVPKGPQRKG